MSRNNNSAKKPYCKVCHDAGKSESEYTSHWVKSLPDRNGKSNVTCPTLLSNECRYCFKLGHTAKFCPVLVQNKKDKERSERQVTRREEEAQKKVKVEKLKPVRGFMALHEDSSDTEEEELKVSTLRNIVVEEFPALGAQMKTMAVQLPSVKPEAKTGWVHALAKPKPNPEKVANDIFLAKIEERSMIKQLPQSALKSKPDLKPKPVIEWKPTLRASDMNWADLSDSDSDDDEVEVAPGPPMPYQQSSLTRGWTTRGFDDEDW
jgi:hypothetical protein